MGRRHSWLESEVFHYPLPTLMSRNFRLPRTIELQPLSLTPLKMRKVELEVSALSLAMAEFGINSANSQRRLLCH